MGSRWRWDRWVPFDPPVSSPASIRSGREMRPDNRANRLNTVVKRIDEVQTGAA
jgi:hypothetical protein